MIKDISSLSSEYVAMCKKSDNKSKIAVLELES